jgi:hypothetical protein
MDAMSVYYAAKDVYQVAGAMQNEPGVRTLAEIEAVRKEVRKLSKELVRLRKSIVRRKKEN